MSQELKNRLLSALIGIPICLIIIISPLKLLYISSIALIGCLLAKEIINFSYPTNSFSFYIYTTIVLICFTKYAYYNDLIENYRYIYLIPMSILIILMLVLFIKDILNSKKNKFKINISIEYLSLNFLALFIGGAMFSYLIDIRYEFQHGYIYVIFLFLIAWMHDTGGYFIGRLIPFSKINLSISPNKTWGGLIGGITLAITSAYGFYYSILFFLPDIHQDILLFQLNYFSYFIITFFLSFCAFLGDFFESFLKRSAKIKDSGFLVKGHGGFFDVLDSIIMTNVFLFWILLTLKN